MFGFVFGVVVGCWCLLALYFSWRYVLRRRPQSIAVAIACLGWPLMVARELKWLSRAPTSVFLGAAFIAGVFGVWVVAAAESQRVRPFR